MDGWVDRYIGDKYKDKIVKMWKLYLTSVFTGRVYVYKMFDVHYLYTLFVKQDSGDNFCEIVLKIW